MPSNKAVRIVIVGLAASFSVLAEPIPQLINTGIGWPPGFLDYNYSFEVIGGGSNDPFNQGGAAINNIGHSYIGTDLPGEWIANSVDSLWLTPETVARRSTGFDFYVDGLYKWTLNFDLTGYIPSSALLSGYYLADNHAIVSLNGNQLVSGGGYNAWTYFAATDYFIQGINKLEFLVTNQASCCGYNATGLRVQFLSSEVSPVPEPETNVLMLVGLGLMGLVARRR